MSLREGWHGAVRVDSVCFSWISLDIALLVSELRLRNRRMSTNRSFCDGRFGNVNGVDLVRVE